MRINYLNLLLLFLTINMVKAQDSLDAQNRLEKMKVQATTTSLLQFAASGDLTTIKLLVESGIDINATESNFGATALHNAAALGHLKMVKWLVENGADANAKDNQEAKAVYWAEYHKQKDVIKYLKTNKINYTNKRQTILIYPNQTEQFDMKIPQSSFHDWEQSQTEARSILKQWEDTTITIPWTELQLKRYVKHKIMPGKSARGLALMHVAMHDALILATSQNNDEKLAVSMAAAQVLAYIFPAEERAFIRTVYSLAALKYNVKKDDLGQQVTQAFKIGSRVAQQVVEYAQNDGAQRGWNGTRLQWYGEGRYYGPGSWEPTPPYFYYPPEEPYAPTWKTWFVKDGSQFRAPPLPIYGSAEFIDALKEVITINKNLNKEEIKAANFWVDGHGTVTPAGHWNQIAMKYSQKENLDNFKTAQLFTELNISLADTYITAWESKYHYWSIRPVTAANKLLDIKFKPAILTPPFPSYVSGHAATSGAASLILSKYFPKSAKILLNMGDAAAMSRLYGGIHYRFDNDQGLIQGRKVAELIHLQFNK